MNVLQKARLLWQLNQLQGAIDKERKMGYDFKIGAAKALRDFIITALAVAGAAVCSYFAVPENIASVLGFLPDSVEKALIPLLSSAFVFGLNWLKNRK